MATPHITVDGIEYAPVTHPRRPTIGVGITTRNRNKVLADCLTQWRTHTPADVPIIVVDDASDKPVDAADHRFDTRVGVSKAKNKTIELLVDLGVEHLFLADDDVFPTADRWWEPYVASPEPHLMYIFADLKKPPLLKDIHRMHADDQHVAWSGARGCLLYAHRTVIDTVGGMDSDAFPGWGYEHGDWSNRIHHAGLTTWRYADVTGSDQLWHSMDEWGEVTRSVSTAEREQRVRDNVKVHHRRREDWHVSHAPYRAGDDVICTTLFTAGTSTKSERGYRPDVKLLADLIKSIRHGRLVVFHDQLKPPPGVTTGNGRPVEFIQSPPPQINVFFHRHMIIWQWLRQHPEVGRVWCVDGTDVQQLRDPFSDIQPDMIHLGWEPKTLRDQWMITRHHEPRVAQFLADNPDRQLLNAGLIGGDRATVMEFLHALYGYWFDIDMLGDQHDIGDMGALNRIAYQRFDGRIVTGSAIATVFKAFEKAEGNGGVSIWAHK